MSDGNNGGGGGLWLVDFVFDRVNCKRTNPEEINRLGASEVIVYDNQTGSLIQTVLVWRGQKNGG